MKPPPGGPGNNTPNFVVAGRVTAPVIPTGAVIDAIIIVILIMTTVLEPYRSAANLETTLETTEKSGGPGIPPIGRHLGVTGEISVSATSPAGTAPVTCKATDRCAFSTHPGSTPAPIVRTVPTCGAGLHEGTLGPTRHLPSYAPIGGATPGVTPTPIDLAILLISV